jgi:hypothetical protein
VRGGIREEDEEAFIFFIFGLIFRVDFFIGAEDVAHTFVGVVFGEMFGTLLLILVYLGVPLFELGPQGLDIDSPS